MDIQYSDKRIIFHMEGETKLFVSFMIFQLKT